MRDTDKAREFEQEKYQIALNRLKRASGNLTKVSFEYMKAKEEFKEAKKQVRKIERGE